MAQVERYNKISTKNTNKCDLFSEQLIDLCLFYFTIRAKPIKDKESK